MLLGANNDLENIIIQHLAREGNKTVEEILVLLKKDNFNTTIQGIYRALRKLQKEGVVIKNKKEYALRIPWLLDMNFLLEQAETNFLQSNYIKNLIPFKEKEKKIWYFNNFYKMNNFWSQVLLAMAEISKNKIFLDFNPHTWFHLIQPHQEYQFLKSLLSKSKKMYTILADKSYLDNYATKFWNFKNFDYHLTNKGYYSNIKKTTYYTITDDIILTITLNKNTALEIENIYKKTKSIKELDTGNVLDVFNKKTRIKMTIERNSEKSLKEYKRFEKIFGKILKLI